MNNRLLICATHEEARRVASIFSYYGIENVLLYEWYQDMRHYCEFVNPWNACGLTYIMDLESRDEDDPYDPLVWADEMDVWIAASDENIGQLWLDVLDKTSERIRDGHIIIIVDNSLQPMSVIDKFWHWMMNTDRSARGLPPIPDGSSILHPDINNRKGRN